MNVVDLAKNLIPAGTAWLPPETVIKLRKRSGLSLEKLMFQLIPLASALSQPALSGFQVGAAGLGVSGAIYLGANFEFPQCSLNQSIHAEQAVVINAVSRQERALKKLAVSAPPCGYCRQFLYELASGAELEILLDDRPATKLADYLPAAFGPGNLGIDGGLMDSSKHPLQWDGGKPRPAALVKLLLESAARSYAPYTKAAAAVSIEVRGGKTIIAPYLENAAFNPSVSPLQAGLVLLGMAGHSVEEISQATVVQRKDSLVNHAAAAREVLRHLVPHISVQEFLFQSLTPYQRKSDMSKKQVDQSFYFFDFDDNIMFLKTPILLRNKVTGKTKKVSTTDFASIRATLGQEGEWKDYEQFEDTYSRFRDIPVEKFRKGQQQYFVSDMAKEVAKKTTRWQAPSWPLFQYACEKQRPMAIVTARGHSRETVMQGIRLLYEKGLIKKEPNWLAIYSVGNDEVRRELLNSLEDESERKRMTQLEKKSDPTSAYKRIAIRNAVETALEKYGSAPEHRFGMSDDDPENVDLIVKAMCDCKKKHLAKRFFVINTHPGEWVKMEIFPHDYPVTGEISLDKYIV